MKISKKLILTGALLYSFAAQAQILIGQTAGHTGAVASGAKETTDGAKLYLDLVNSKGGVNGQTIDLISMDDKFDPKLAADNARELVVNKKSYCIVFDTGHTPHRGDIANFRRTCRAFDRALHGRHAVAQTREKVRVQRALNLPS